MKIVSLNPKNLRGLLEYLGISKWDVPKLWPDQNNWELKCFKGSCGLRLGLPMWYLLGPWISYGIKYELLRFYYGRSFKISQKSFSLPINLGQFFSQTTVNSMFSFLMNLFALPRGKFQSNQTLVWFILPSFVFGDKNATTPNSSARIWTHSLFSSFYPVFSPPLFFSLPSSAFSSVFYSIFLFPGRSTHNPWR